MKEQLKINQETVTLKQVPEEISDINIGLDWNINLKDYEVGIDKVLSFLTEAATKGATKISVTSWDDLDGTYELTIYTRKYRSETLEENKARIIKEKTKAKAKLEADKAERRAQYLELKKEFGND